MCRTKMAVDASQPIPSTTGASRRTKTTPTRPSNSPRAPKSPQLSDPSTSNVTSAFYSSGTGYKLDSSTATASASVSSRTSLSSLRNSLPENPHIYDFSEIRSATNNFLAKRYSASSSPCWKCVLRGKDVVIFQHKFLRSIETSELKEKMKVICRSHHMSIIKLLGASISGNHIYLVYEFINGANLSDCLRNSKNPTFTVLSTWISRMQIATDLAHGLDYIHNNTGSNIYPVHKYVKSTSVIVTEPAFNAKICHFGRAELCGDISAERNEGKAVKGGGSGEITEDLPDDRLELRRSNSRMQQFEGVRGYMSPEFRLTGIATQKSDVYAFGVVILELLSGEEPVRYRFDKSSKDYRKISVIDTARDAIENGDGGEEGMNGRLRRWVDRRLKDSFPVDVAEKLTRTALDCVQDDADKRPDMRRVAGKISKLYLDSRIWSDRVRVPTDFSVSLAPR